MVQARHNCPSMPANFSSVLSKPTKKFFRLVLRTLAVCCWWTQTLLQGGADVPNAGLLQQRTALQCPSKSLTSPAQRSSPMALEGQVISPFVTRAFWHANFQPSPFPVPPVLQAAPPRRRSVLRVQRQGKPGVTRCRYPWGPPRVAVVLDPGWRGARDSRWRSVAGPRAPAGAQLRLRAVGPPVPFMMRVPTMPARRVALSKISRHQCCKLARASPTRPRRMMAISLRSCLCLILHLARVCFLGRRYTCHFWQLLLPGWRVTFVRGKISASLNPSLPPVPSTPRPSSFLPRQCVPNMLLLAQRP